MIKVAVYLAAVPAKSKNQSKRAFLSAFAAGVRRAGDIALPIETPNVIDCDIAVLQGWIGMKSGPHLDLRRQVIEHQKKQGRHVMVIDSNLFGFLAPEDRDRYLRYSLDGIFPTTGYYFDQNIDRTRWPRICHDYAFQPRDWNLSGQSVLICLQRDGGWSMDGLNVIDWLSHIIPQIRQHTTRPIIIRGHPGSTKTLPLVRERWPDIAISEEPDIRDDLQRTWCTVTYNSSPGVASLLYGVPVFVTDPDPCRSQAWPCVNTKLSQIENPDRPDRTEFFDRLSQCHFRTDDLATGEAWKFFRDRLP